MVTFYSKNLAKLLYEKKASSSIQVTFTPTHLSAIGACKKPNYSTGTVFLGETRLHKVESSIRLDNNVYYPYFLQLDMNGMNGKVNY